MNPSRSLPPPTVSCRPVRGRVGQRGFALITVLWLVAMLTTIVGLALGAIRLGNEATSNRIALARGRWAADACFAIVQARRAQGRLREADTVDLGRGTRCAWKTDDPTARINVDSADAEILRAVDTNVVFEQAVLNARHVQLFESVAALAELPGFDSTTAELWTVDGPGSVNLSAASPKVLQALPGLSSEAVARIAYRREVGRAYPSLDALAAELSPPARALLMAHYSDLARLVTFSAPELLVTATGWVESQPVRATVEFLVVPLPDRLAVIRRREW